jgi:aspartate aminotransferase
MKVEVSATLRANEVLADRKLKGLSVLPMAFGQAGLPVHPLLRRKLSDASIHNGYGAVAGNLEIRTAAAGYWSRRGLLTDPSNVVCGPGSKPLLYALLLSIGGDVVIPVPSWVSYAVQAKIIGARPILVPTIPGQGGVPDPDLLTNAVNKSRSRGRKVKSIIVTLPDNPTGTLAGSETIKKLCRVARELDLLIISDEIYRDLVFDESEEFVSPADIAPERTIITSGLSKNLALGGWRIGFTRLPDNPTGHELLSQLKGIASEIWSSTAVPVQHVAAYALDEPAELIERIEASKKLHSKVAYAVTSSFRAVGAKVNTPQAAFYIYPNLESWRDLFESKFSITTGTGLAKYLLDEYGLGILPGSDFGEPLESLKFRVATSQLYGDSSEQLEFALSSSDPLSLPWIQDNIENLDQVLSNFIVN